MRLLTADELTDLERYARLRPEYRRAVIAHKKSRRMAVGDRVTLVFEDRETLRFQVQEMLFVERIGDAEHIQRELDIYNELMPGDDELSATLFIEITDLPEIRPELDRLIGLDEHVSLRIGLGEDTALVPARFDAKQLEEDRISAVQYIRFQLDPERAALFADRGTPVAVRIDHPAYTCEAPVPAEVRESLAAGLRNEPAPLLDPARVGSGAPRVWFETARVHAVERPGAGRVHVVVEAQKPSLLDDALWRELGDALRRAADEVATRHGSARIQADWDGRGGSPRFHVVSAGEPD